jgi:glycopeptide antibiotics resistance protein/heat shock protein HslJ
VTRHVVAVVACLVSFLVFIPAAQALAQPADPQLMRSWILVLLDGSAVPADSGVTATFASDGVVSGSGGCDDYRAAYRAAASLLTVGPIVAGDATCDADREARQQTFFRLFADASGYAVEDRLLTITTAGGGSLSFEHVHAEASALVLIVPLAMIVSAIIWRGRRRRIPGCRLLQHVVVSLYAAAVVAFAFFPIPLPPWELPAGVSFIDTHRLPLPWAKPVPFATIRESLENWDQAGAYLLGNLLAFVPLGALVAWARAASHSWRLAMLVGVGVSLGIEVLQLGLSLAMGFPYRVADIDDVIVNLLGTMIGYLTIRSVLRVATRHFQGSGSSAISRGRQSSRRSDP